MCESIRYTGSVARFRRPTLLLAALVLLSLPTAAVQGASKRNTPSVEEILRRYLRAQQGINLRGKVRIIHTGPQEPSYVSTQYLIRSREGHSRVVHLEPASERGMTTQDDGQWMRLYEPKSGCVKVQRSLARSSDPGFVERQLRLIRRNYRVTLNGTEPMAGRPCYRLRLQPHAPISRTIQLWTDTQTGAELGRQESDRRGNTLCLVLFTSVEFPQRIAPAELRLKVPPKAKRTNYSRSPILRDVGKVRRLAGYNVILPLTMPGGFVFESSALVQVGGGQRVCLRYTDGLAHITIVQSPARQRRPDNYRACRVMSLPRGDTIVDCACGPMNFMIMGNGAPEALIGVAQSLDAAREMEWRAQLARIYRVSPATLAGLRNRGLGMDCITALLEISARTRQPLTNLLSLYENSLDWRYLARRFGVQMEYIGHRVQRFQQVGNLHR